MENLSLRCPASLTNSLRTVAAAADELLKLPFPAAGEIPDATASRLGVEAVAQYRAALKLQEALMAAWAAVRDERGGT